MKKILILFSALLFLIPSPHMFAGDGKKKGKFAFNGFSGGMRLHTGYIGGGSAALSTAGGAALSPQKVTGMPFGIGGAAKLHFGDWLRVGGEGYSTSLTYGDYKSNFNISWGGFLADCVWRNEKFSPFAGATFGGGTVRNITLTAHAPLDFTTEENTSYRKYGFMCVVPFVGVEYSVTPRLRLIFKTDYMINITNRQDDFSSGPRVYIGVSFCRNK